MFFFFFFFKNKKIDFFFIKNFFFFFSIKKKKKKKKKKKNYDDRELSRQQFFLTFMAATLTPSLTKTWLEKPCRSDLSSLKSPSKIRSSFNLLPQKLSERKRVILTAEMLKDSYVKSTLKSSQHKTFVDIFFDNPDNELLIQEHCWLLLRNNIPSDGELIWKLRASFTVKSETMLQWAEYSGEESILALLTAAGLPSGKQLVSLYSNAFLKIYTKRYHISTNCWVDFVGWYVPADSDSGGIYAICTHQIEDGQSLDPFFTYLANFSDGPLEAPSKTKLMLAKQNCKLFGKVFPSTKISDFLSFFQSGLNFSIFDDFFGLVALATKLSSEASSDDEAESDE